MPVAWINLLLRLFAWLLATAVTFASLGPPRYRPHSHLGQDGEHSLAFVLIGVAFALAYPRYRLPATVIAVAMVGTLELLQLLVPGRHARLEDFAVDALATLTGFAIVSVLDVAIARRRRANPTSP
jgi:VanZ family protein